MVSAKQVLPKRVRSNQDRRVYSTLETLVDMMGDTEGVEVIKVTPNEERRVVQVDPIDRYSAFIVRGTIIGTGLVGLALFFRHSRLFVRFDKAAHIPDEIVKKELKLRGKVREVLPSGILKVEHQPMIQIPRILSFRRITMPIPLSIRLAGVDISPAGADFLTKHLRLRDKEVIFTVVKPIDDKADIIDADITLKKNAFFHTNLNVELVRKGYAKVPALSQTEHMHALQTIPAYARLVSRLLMSEKVAERRGVGVWQRDTWVESVAAYPSQFTQMVKSSAVARFAVLVGMVGKDMALSGYRLSQQAYQGLIVFCGYLLHLYRVFGVAVDKMTLLYNNAKQKITRR
uniref:TNase-like domain-containing protein n=2 Tax=Parascaris univalens TaxID=6257 RepID=A0A914ZLE7_PARUN